MTTRGILTIASIFLTGFILLWLGRCGYDRLQVFRSIDSVVEHIRQEFPGVAPADPETFVLYLEGEPPPLLVDVRSAEEFALSRIPGAISLSTAAAVSDHLEKRDNDPEVILLYGSLGLRSARLAEELGPVEGARVLHLEGGLFRWANQDRALVTGDSVTTRFVHPYNRVWGRLLKEDRRASLEGAWPVLPERR